LQLTLTGQPAMLDMAQFDMTFKGGAREPMHQWYPLLEGYSSGFVRAVLERFAPSSQSVLDPFCGTGTTVLECSRLARASYYCEVNPALQLLIHAKIRAVTMTQDDRLELANALRHLAVNFKGLLDSADEDQRLRESYESVFGDSQFFSAGAFTKVLKARAVIDTLDDGDQILSDFLTLATIASLIGTSRLRRAGDLRFRRQDELHEIAPLERLVRGKLIQIENDLARLRSSQAVRPLMICEDARKLASLPAIGVDAVVTSPPYVNGTNYFRNTKVELWFLRCLASSADLRLFRDKAVSAGINDVSMSRKVATPDSARLQNVLAELEKKAYDRRIPRLVEGYFADLTRVFDGTYAQMVSGGMLAVDIGDSIFGEVHVPTDDILVQVLQSLGYQSVKKLNLRKRQSHSGAQLRQVLLVFRKVGGRSACKPAPGHSWEKHWTQFKDSLPHQQTPFAKRNWGHPLHSLCSYQGKMKPSLAHYLVKTFLPNGGVMLDPFAGVGTIPFEGALFGVRSFGFEINPAARYIAAAKVGKPLREDCQETLRLLRTYLNGKSVSREEIKQAGSFGFNHKLSEFFHETTLREILLARHYFNENPPSNPSECLVMACLLHILHGNRPYSLSRRSHPITPFAPTGPYEYRALMPRLVEKVNRSLSIEYPTTFVEGSIYDQDATTWWPTKINDLDAIITSPPFFDSTRFYMANWLRLWFSGWEPVDFDKKPKSFVDERQKLGFEVYEPVLRQSRERLREGGVVVFHLGGSKKCNMADEISKVASRWFTVVDVFHENVSHCESHGIRDKGTVTEHQYLVLE
jgi:tRNA G10  N-methylase Trm11